MCNNLITLLFYKHTVNLMIKQLSGRQQIF
jgi:hypothetical protein